MSAISIECPYIDLVLQHASIKDELLEAVSEVIDSGQFILGPSVKKFEEQFAAMVGVKKAIGVNSGTDALIFALKALGIGPGDEVITVPNSFVASTSCIEIVGARAVFVDIGKDYNMNPNELKKALTKQTKAILPVHLTGKPVDMDPLLSFAKQHKLYVIEDCAQAVKAEYRGNQVGSIGDIGCFSLHPLKTLNALGDAGIVTTNREDVAEKIYLYRNLGLQTRENCVLWCSNSRLDSIQASMLLVKMKYLDYWTECRRRNAALYRILLGKLPEIVVPDEAPYEKAVYHTFMVLAEKRDELKNYLAERNIGSAIHYPIPIHKQAVAAQRSHLQFPRSEEYASKILSLPVHQDLREEQICYVAETIRLFYQ